ncbi:MAG: hypothetical protein M0P95_07115 [Sulfuritalea sp.]|jgi:hypothetical protein|nr:hypothetical protein [Sulfuritalea sp.]
MESKKEPSATAVGMQDASPARIAERTDGRGGAAVPRLEKRTLLNEAHYRVSLTDYGNGLAEIGWSFVPVLRPIAVGKGESDFRDLNEQRAVRRARSRLRKLILTTKADHLLTLTYRSNQEDFTQASSDLTKFIRRVRQHHPKWLFIAVAERQKRGAWHWHLAVPGRQDVNLLRACWHKVVGEGNIDVSAPRGNEMQRQLRLVAYLGKYLAKGFDDSETRRLNARRFRSSLGIAVPFETIDLPEEYRLDVIQFMFKYLKQTAGNVGFVWRSKDDRAGWACSWS